MRKPSNGCMQIKKPAVCDISCQTISWPPARVLYWLAHSQSILFDKLVKTCMRPRPHEGVHSVSDLWCRSISNIMHILHIWHERLDINRFKPLGTCGFLPFAVFNQLIHQCGKKCPVSAKVYSLTSCTPLPKAMKLAWAKKLSCWRTFVILTIQQCPNYIKLKDIVFCVYLLWMHFGHLR